MSTFRKPVTPIPTATDDPLMSPKQVAQLLNVHPTSVYRWVHQGLLRAVRMGSSRFRIRKSAALAMLQPVQVVPLPPTAAEERRKKEATNEILRRHGLPTSSTCPRKFDQSPFPIP